MATPQRKTAVIYCRVSTKDQVDNTSLESQERACRDYATRNDLAVLKVFVDEGESAKTTDRPEFNKAVAFCQKQKSVAYFLVYKLDRFARNQGDHVVVRAMLNRAGTELRSATEPINDSPVGKALEGMFSVCAEFDKNVRTERTKSGMLERVKQGVWVWQCPIGYYRPTQGANIAPEPVSAPLVRLAFEEYAKGVYTYRSLATFLAERGLRTRYGLEPGQQQIEKMLRNPIYKGVIDAWEEEHNGSFEAIVSSELFASCQHVADGGHGHTAPRSLNNPNYPLRGAVRCSECQKTLTGSASTSRQGKRYPYYHHHTHGCAKTGSIPKETLEQLFVEHMEAITPSHAFEKLFREIVLDLWKTNFQQMDNVSNQVRREIQTLTHERQKVFELHRAGKYTDDEFLEQKNGINRQIDQKTRLLNEQHVEELDMDSALEHCFWAIRNATKIWMEPNYARKIQLQNTIFTGPPPFNGKNFGTSDLSIIYELGLMSPVSKTSLVAPRGIEPRLSA